jgi:hypothetical protein
LRADGSGRETRHARKSRKQKQRKRHLTTNNKIDKYTTGNET